MKDLTLSLALRPYLAEWLTTRFGRPVRFPVRSYENLLLHSLVVRGRVRGVRCADEAPPGKRVVHIVLTDSSRRRPEYWHVLTRRASQDMARALERLFRLQLWSECAPLLFRPSGLNAGLDEWCRRQGIAIEHREGVRQKFYRMRKAYEAQGIKIGQKRCHDGGKK